MKYEIEVSRLYVNTIIVDADDEDHAKSIASEYSNEMPLNFNTFWESNWKVKQADQEQEITYTPTQKYLK